MRAGFIAGLRAGGRAVVRAGGRATFVLVVYSCQGPPGRNRQIVSK